MDTLPKSKFENCLKLINLGKNSDADQQLHYQASILFLIAEWQGSIEDNIKNAMSYCIKNIENISNYPKPFREKIVKNELSTAGGNIDKQYVFFENLLGSTTLKKIVSNHIEKCLGSFNTPSIQNTRELFDKCFGIKIKSLLDDESTKIINEVLETRHLIAHGTINKNVDPTHVSKAVKLLTNCLGVIEAELEGLKNEISGATHNIGAWDLPNLISWIEKNVKEGDSFNINKIKSHNTWYSNHNKLSYSSWGLLEGKTDKRKPTDRFWKFINGDIKLPRKITLINKSSRESRPLSKSDCVSWSDIKPTDLITDIN